MSGEKKPPIIKKIIKKGHGGHHGGSWKVAYADFVTALMAFFLVMWLLAISSQAGKEAMAEYFNELTMTEAIFNGGMPGTFDPASPKPSILDGGCFSLKAEQGDATIDTEGDEGMLQAQMAALLMTTQSVMEKLESLPDGVDGGEGSGDVGRAENEGVLPPTAEERQFAGELRAEIQGSLGDAAAGQVFVEKVKGGLRIQIIDQAGRPIFASGGPGLTKEGQSLLDIVAQRLRSIPNKVSIEGHTDAKPFAGQRITNWELSTARASSARLYLARAGLSEDRLTMVAGYAATKPLPDTDPNDPVNRRISVMIWDEEPQPGKSSAGTPGLGNGGASTQPPSLPRRNNSRERLRPQTPNRQLSGEELEKMLIDRTMEQAATPDLSTVGPPVTSTPEN